MAKSRAGEWLEAARAAVREGRFAEALERYDYFFEHALEEDRYLCGVRVTYCLEEWAELGKLYPPARTALHDKKIRARGAFVADGDTGAFDDFVSICGYVDCRDEAVELFAGVHAADRELAGKIVTSVWGDLIAAEQWELCGAYVPDWQARYSRALDIFDMDMDDDLPLPFARDVYQAGASDEFVRRVGNLFLVLEHTGRADEADALRRRVTDDMRARGREALAARVVEVDRGEAGPAARTDTN